MFYKPQKKYPLLYNAVIRTGLAATPDMPSLDDVGENALLPPYTNDMPGMEEAKLRGVVISNISIFLHNAFFCKDFPSDKRLERLFVSAEKKMKRISTNPWVELMYKAGKQGECPDPEVIDKEFDPVTKVHLSMARPEFEKTVPALIVLFVDWVIEKRSEVESWQLDRIKVFSE